MKVGFSKVDITPEPGYPLGGFLERYLGENKSKGTLNPIYARAIYLNDGKSEFVGISLEVVVIENGLAKEIREKISKALGLPRNNVAIFATHTHSAPDTMKEIWLYKHFLPEEYFPLIEKYRKFLVEKAIQATNEAKANAEETRLFVGKDIAEGACANRISPELVSDPEVYVVFDEEKRGAFINFTCHPTVLHHNNMFYSGDFYSYVDAPGKIFVFSTGAAGDQSTRFVRKSTGPEEAERIGKIIKEAVLRAMEKGEEIPNEFSVYNFIVKLEKRDVKEEKLNEKLERKARELEKMLEKITDKGMLRKIENALGAINLMLQIYDVYEQELKKMPDTFDAEVSILRFGKKLAIVFIPVELFCRYGLEIKRESPFEHTFVVTYANGYLGYMPTKEAYEEVDYEALATSLKPGSAEKLTDEIIKKLREIY